MFDIFPNEDLAVLLYVLTVCYLYGSLGALIALYQYLHKKAGRLDGLGKFIAVVMLSLFIVAVFSTSAMFVHIMGE